MCVVKSIPVEEKQNIYIYLYKWKCKKKWETGSKNCTKEIGNYASKELL